MIQRIQTLYLLIAIGFLIPLVFGLNFFSFVNESGDYVFSVFGVSQLIHESSRDVIVSYASWPIYIAVIIIVLLCVATIMSYKDLKKQFKLGRLTFFVYFLLLLAIVVLSLFGDSILGLENAKRELGIGYLLLVLGFPFTFLANTGIKRDKTLIDSIDRIR